jgi:hypothetical protein
VTMPAHIEQALRQIGVVPPKREVPPRPPMPTGGPWYRSEDDIPF